MSEIYREGQRWMVCLVEPGTAEGTIRYRNCEVDGQLSVSQDAISCMKRKFEHKELQGK